MFKILILLSLFLFSSLVGACISLPTEIDLDKAKDSVQIEINNVVYLISKFDITWTKSESASIAKRNSGILNQNKKLNYYELGPKNYPSEFSLEGKFLESKTIIVNVKVNEPARSESLSFGDKPRSRPKSIPKGEKAQGVEVVNMPTNGELILPSGCGSSKVKIKYN